jgi:hypothetical protein
MKKRRLVIASILKPVNDTRMYEKLGRSLCQNPDLEVHIIGYPSKSFSAPESITFHPLKNFRRISFGRLVAPLKVALLVYQVKPEVLIVTSHELLIVNFLNRIFFGTKIVYDVQENYYRNILFSGSFPWLFRLPIAGWVRLKEWMISPWINWFFLAEKGYEKELQFIGKRFTVLENKSTTAPSLFRKSRTDQKIKLLFSGTLSESTGVFHAINLTTELNRLNPAIELTIIGFCALAKTREVIKDRVKNLPFIHLVGMYELVPHATILQPFRTLILVSFTTRHHPTPRTPSPQNFTNTWPTNSPSFYKIATHGWSFVKKVKRPFLSTLITSNQNSFSLKWPPKNSTLPLPKMSPGIRKSRGLWRL